MFEALANVIRGRFVSQVVGSTGLAVAYDNAPFDPPAEMTWVRFSIIFGDSGQVELQRFRTVGAAVAQIFVPAGKGDRDALKLGDQVVAAFRVVSLAGMTFRTPSIRRVGRTESWYQVNVNCPFYADDQGD